MRSSGKPPFFIFVCVANVLCSSIFHKFSFVSHLSQIFYLLLLFFVLRDFGFSLGPFQMADLSGLDVGYNIRKGKNMVDSVPVKKAEEVGKTGYGLFGSNWLFGAAKNGDVTGDAAGR